MKVITNKITLLNDQQIDWLTGIINSMLYEKPEPGEHLVLEKRLNYDTNSKT